MDDINDRYVVTAPSDQNAVDIFKGQWISGFSGQEPVLSGGTVPLYSDPRIDWLLKRLGRSLRNMRVAELGPFEAGHSYMVHKAGAKEIVSIEGHTLSYLKCLIAKEVFKLDRLSVKCGEIESWLANEKKKLDLIVASGVLYHFKDPLLALFNMSRSAQRIFLWTHYVHDDYMPFGDPRRSSFTGQITVREVMGFECNYHYRSYEGSEQSPAFCGGIYADSVWIEHRTIVGALNSWGFKVQEVLPQIDHPGGPASCFYAWRS